MYITTFRTSFVWQRPMELCFCLIYGKFMEICLPPENLVLPTYATVPLRLLGRTWILSPTINQPKTDFFIRKKRRFPSKCHVDHRPTTPLFYNKIENRVGRIIFCLFVITLGQVRLYKVLGNLVGLRPPYGFGLGKKYLPLFSINLRGWGLVLDKHFVGKYNNNKSICRYKLPKLKYQALWVGI